MMKAKLMLALLLSLTLAGCSANNASKSNDQSSQTTSSSQSASSSSSSTSSQSTATADVTKVKVSVATAIKKYQQAFPNSDITGISLEKQLGTYQYEVEGVGDSKEYSLKLDAKTAAVTSKKSEALDADEANGVERKADALNLDNLISVNEAVQKAQSQAKNQPATEISLDREASQTYWDVQFESQGQETSVKVNAQSGKVLATERDDDD